MVYSLPGEPLSSSPTHPSDGSYEPVSWQTQILFNKMLTNSDPVMCNGGDPVMCNGGDPVMYNDGDPVMYNDGDPVIYNDGDPIR